VTQSVPLNDLSRIPDELRDKIIAKAGDVISSGNYILGPEVEKFETELSSYLGSGESVGVSTGTDAIILSLLAAGVVPGDVVLTMANAGSYTTVAARAICAEPIFVDVSGESLQMTLENIQKSLSLAKRASLTPKAIVVTHLFGQLNPEIFKIAQLCKKEGLVLIEDCAQAIGASDGLKMAGNFGSLSTFSFFPTKNLGASGDAGAVSGTNPEMLSKVRRLRQYGWASKYSIDIPFGRNSRLDEIQAAILRVKLPYVSTWNQKRRDVYSRYVAAARKSVKFYSIPDESYVGHLCPITVDGFSQIQLLDFFASKGVSASVHFPVPDHLQKIELKFRNLVPLPETEKSCANLVTIPIFPELTEIEIQKVCDALGELGR
jgi:dTDP-4-amino-4,6-dideoxygalactose transaminase